MTKAFFTALLSCILLSSSVADNRLSIHPELIALDTPDGQSILSHSHNKHFWQLMLFYTTQQNLGYCGVASSVMVLNASRLSPPETEAITPFRIFDQDNFFNKDVLKVIHPSHVKSNGMSLSQLAQAINTFGPATEIIYAADLNLDQMRQRVISALDADNQWIIGNFHRKYIHEVGNGHFSPIAAYDQVSDRFLILDVARYKYPPVWVKTADLYRAMTLSADGKVVRQRGFVIVRISPQFYK
jgi:hypothetical protein